VLVKQVAGESSSSSGGDVWKKEKQVQGRGEAALCDMMLFVSPDSTPEPTSSTPCGLYLLPWCTRCRGPQLCQPGTRAARITKPRAIIRRDGSPPASSCSAKPMLYCTYLPRWDLMYSTWRMVRRQGKQYVKKNSNGSSFMYLGITTECDTSKIHTGRVMSSPQRRGIQT